MKNTIVFLESTPTGTGPLYFRRALALGLRPVLFSAEPSRHEALAEFEKVALAEMTADAVLAAIDRLGRSRIAGVWSSLDDWSELAARVSQALGRPGADPDAVAVCCDKFKTRQALAQAGIEDVGFVLVWSGEEAAAAAHSLGGRVVVKPRSSSGSCGVRLCGSPEEARRHFETLTRGPPGAASEGVLVESLIDGPQFSVELFDGRVIGVTGQHFSPAPASFPIGHDFPPADGLRVRDEIAAYAQRATAAAGHCRGPAHTEVRYGAHGPRIVEINPRLAGAMIPEHVRIAIGVDLIDATVRFACGMPYDLARLHSRASAGRDLVRTGARTAAVAGRENAAKVPGVVEVGIFPARFGRDGPPSDFQDCIAYVIAGGDNAREAIRSAELGLAKLRIVPEKTWRRAARRAVGWVRLRVPVVGSAVRSLRRFSLRSANAPSCAPSDRR